MKKFHEEVFNEFIMNCKVVPIKKNRDGTKKWSLNTKQTDKLFELLIKKHYLYNKALFLKTIQEIDKINKPLAEKFKLHYQKITK